MNYFKYFLLLFIVVSCQNSRKYTSIQAQRKIASILFKESKIIASKVITIELSQTPRSIVPLDFTVIDQVKIKKDIDVKCINYDSFLEDEGFITYKFSPSRSFLCSSNKVKSIAIEYQVLESKLTESYMWDEVRQYLVEKVQSSQFDSIITELQQLGVASLFQKRFHYDEIKNIPLENDDYIAIEYKSFEKFPTECRGNDCAWTNGRKILDQKVTDKSLYKYHFLPPFLLFCGPRYPAAQVWFRADEDYFFDKVIDSTGFSCDLNHLMNSSEKYYFYFSTYVIKKEKFAKQFPQELEELIIKINDKKVIDLEDDLKVIKQKLKL